MKVASRRNNKLLHALIGKGPYHGYFPGMEKIWHLCAEGKEEEEAKAYFKADEIKVHFTRGQRYLGGFCGGQK